jgi:Transposase domain (DUF772)
MKSTHSPPFRMFDITARPAIRLSARPNQKTSQADRIVTEIARSQLLAGSIDWRFLEQRLGAMYTDKPGHPPLPTRLMAGLAILKHMHDLSDEVLPERWVENPYFQYFCGEEFFQHRVIFDRSSLTRWRQRLGEEKLLACRTVRRSRPGPKPPSRLPTSPAS